MAVKEVENLGPVRVGLDHEPLDLHRCLSGDELGVDPGPHSVPRGSTRVGLCQLASFVEVSRRP